MKYIICHPREIDSTARRLTNQLLRDGSSLSIVLELILSTAASNLQYTRSLALVAKRITEHLKSRGSGIAGLFQEEIGDLSLAVFIRHFMDAFERGTDKTRLDDNIVPDVMPLAISAFIGDLTSMGLISFTAFDACMGFLMKRIRTRLHIRCLQHLLGHAGARHLPQITVPYVRDCARMVRKRADKHLQCYSLEEDELRELMKDIVTRHIGSYYREEWDRRLDLDLALQASVVHFLPGRCDTRSISPDGSESGSVSTSSLLASPRSKSSSLTLSPASSVDSANSIDEAKKGKAAVASHAARGSVDDAHRGLHTHQNGNRQAAGNDDNADPAPLVIYAPQPIRPAQSYQWLWL
ncbi:hypothetical protein D9619_011008 [Psilocybe cf. subviscida]|uniref:Uncharacterized protein n=1 Tax=Psilocybe cf. subviscida TaxID=2480587 RepID=A0A8H5B8P1_9AGAR|nr:hypothetical protein D9619_011008 [Psilocybe cf. subviscida]